MEQISRVLTMIPAPVSIAAILFLLVCLLALLTLLREKIALDAEWSRKLAHILMGLVTLTFPWLFDTPGPVVLLAVLALALITAIRFWPPLRSLLGKSILCSERFTLGEFFFPLGILSAFLLSDGDNLLYVVSVLTLTLADPTAAFVGIGMARMRRRPLPRKSIEGSLAFMLISGLMAFFALKLIAGMSVPESLLISLNFGVVLALIEAVSLWGTDNVTVPVGAILLLKTIPYFSVSAQIFLLVFSIIMVGVLPILFRRKAVV